MTPPAGPGEERIHRHLAHRAGRHRAAVRLHDARRARDAELGDALLEALEIAVHDRHQARVHRRGGEALELAKLREHVARRAEIDLGPELLHERRARAPRARDSRRRAGSRSRPPRRSSPSAPRPRGARRLRRAASTSAAVVRDAPVDFDAAIARRRRHRLRDVEIEVVRPALARELEHVAKARGREHAGARPLAFEHRVRRERGAEHEELHVARARARSGRAARRCRRGCPAPDRR